MKRGTWLAVACAAATLGAGCGAAGSYTFPGDAMPVFTQEVHVYPGATLETAMGGDYYGDEGHTAETLTWWFKTSADQDQVAEWYAKRLPAAARSRDEDGNMVFTYTPEGAEPGEEITVRVGNQEFRITEETKPGKHKEA